MVDDLMCILKRFFNWLVDTLFDILDFLIGWLIKLLPESPFQFNQIEWGPFGQLIGTFIPVASILTHFTLILLAISLYYGIRHLIRLVKMVS